MTRHAAALLVVAVMVGVGGCASTGSSNGRPTSQKDAAHANVQLGVAYLQQGNLALAKEKLERAEKQDPRSFEVHWVMASLNEQLNLPAEAERHYQIAQRLAPENSEVANTYGVFLCRSGKVEPALRLFETAMRDPLYRTPWAAATNAAVCLRSDKRAADAVPYLERAIAQRPDFVSAVVELADLQLSLGQAQQSREVVDRFNSIGRKSADVLLVGVRAAMAEGNRPAAEIYARLMRRDFPNAPQTRSLPQLLPNLK
jgi:type IV pilus assembly protein PilF